MSFLIKRYKQFLTDKPLLTKSLTAGFLFGLGDFST